MLGAPKKGFRGKTSEALYFLWWQRVESNSLTDSETDGNEFD